MSEYLLFFQTLHEIINYSTCTSTGVLENFEPLNAKEQWPLHCLFPFKKITYLGSWFPSKRSLSWLLILHGGHIANNTFWQHFSDQKGSTLAAQRVKKIQNLDYWHSGSIYYADTEHACMWANTVRANAEDSYSRTPVIHPWVLQQPGFYNGPVESRRSPCINNALKTSVIRHTVSCLTRVLRQLVRSAWLTGGRNGSAAGLFREPEARSIFSVASFVVSFPSSSRRRLCTIPFPLFSLASPPVLQRSQAQCAGVYLSHTAVNRQQGYVNRLRLPNVWNNRVCHDSHWLAGIVAVDCGTRFVFNTAWLASELHYSLRIYFFQWFEFPSPAKH